MRRRRSGKIPATLTREVRLLLSEWRSGEIKSGWAISEGQLRLACEQGLLVLVKDSESAMQREYNRTSQPVRLGKSPKVPRLGPRQREILLTVARNELLRKDTREDFSRSALAKLEGYGFIIQKGESAFSRTLRVGGAARKEYLLRAAIEVLILEATKDERRAMDVARRSANGSIPDTHDQDSKTTAADFVRQAKACYAAARVYRRAAEVHRKAVARVKPTKEEALARVLVHEMGESESNNE